MIRLKGRCLSRCRDDVDEQGLLPLGLMSLAAPIAVTSMRPMRACQPVKDIFRPGT